MKTEDMLKMIEVFKDIRDGINSGEMTIADVKEGIKQVKDEIVIGLEQVKNILEDNSIDTLEAEFVKENIDKELKKYNKKQYKEDIRLVLKLASTLDCEIGEELLLPIMIFIINESAEVLVNINPKIKKHTNKVMEKFLLERETKCL